MVQYSAVPLSKQNFISDLITFASINQTFSLFYKRYDRLFKKF